MKYVIVESAGRKSILSYPEITRDSTIRNDRAIQGRTIVGAGHAKYIFEMDRVVGVKRWGGLLGFESQPGDEKILMGEED
jgi:hypothetical protein